MKKELIMGVLFVLLIALVLSFVYAQEQAEAGIDTRKTASDISKKTNEFLEQDIAIPENLQLVARILFGIDKEILLKEFIILAALWFMLFLLLHKILEVVPFFGSGWKSWAGGVIVTCLVSITGSLKLASSLFYDLTSLLNFLEGYNIIKIVLALIIAAVILFMAFKVVDIIKDKAGIETAERQGLEAGVGAGILSQQAKMMRD